ncbi:hypothetical protein AAMO2058_000516300 [Amorphochlora amoebiformis]
MAAHGCRNALSVVSLAGMIALIIIHLMGPTTRGVQLRSGGDMSFTKAGTRVDGVTLRDVASRHVIRAAMRRLSGGAEGDENDITMTEASHCKKGMVVILKDKPCKVIENAVSKVGKHGSAKCHLAGNDIFTGKRVEEICPGHTSMTVPTTKKIEYTVVDLAEDGELSLMDDDNNFRDDLSVPENYEMRSKIEKLFKEEKEFKVVVLRCMGREAISEVKT